MQLAARVLKRKILGKSEEIKIDSKGPILFKQRRVGKNKVLFNIYKFSKIKIFIEY